MTKTKITIRLLSIAALVACGGEKKEITPKNKEIAIEEHIQTTTTSNIDTSIMTEGEKVYTQCLACHQANGEGLSGAFPPLASSDYMLADIDRTIKTILYGTSNPIKVNGKEYPGSTMTKFDGLTDDEIAAVATYVLNSWGNNGGLVTADMVASNR